MPKLPAGVIYLAPLLVGPGDEGLIQRDRSAMLGLCDLFLNLGQVADEGEARVILDEIAGTSAASIDTLDRVGRAAAIPGHCHLRER